MKRKRDDSTNSKAFTRSDKVKDANIDIFVSAYKLTHKDIEYIIDHIIEIFTRLEEFLTIYSNSEFEYKKLIAQYLAFVENPGDTNTYSLSDILKIL